MRSMVPWKKNRDRELARPNRDPFQLLHREVDELFDDFSNSFFDAFPWRGARARLDSFALSEPKVDFTETDDGYEVSADLPGVEEKDLDLSIDEQSLTIRTEQSSEEERKDRNYHIMERSSGCYQRSIPLPADVDHEKIKAKFKNGVLSVSLPKNPEAVSRKRTIEIES